MPRPRGKIAPHGDDRPDRLDHAERPRAGQEPVRRRRQAAGREGQDERRVPPLQRVHRHHERDGHHAVDGDQCVSAHERTGTVSRSTAATTSPAPARSSSTMSAPASRSSLADERPLATPIDRHPPIPAASTSLVEAALYTVVCSVKPARYFSAARPRALTSIAPLGYTSEPKPPMSVSR